MHRRILLFFLLPMFSSAQPFIDIANVYYQYSAADKPTNNYTVYTSLASVSLALPLKIDSDYVLINPVYENFKMTFPIRYTNREFHVGYIPVSWLHRWNAKWKTAFAFIPRVSSQLTNKFSSKDMHWGGAILTTLQKKETLKFKFGLYYNSEFFGPFFMPLLGIDWNVNPKLNIFGVLPGSMNIEYKFRKMMHAGILFRSLTNSYRTSINNSIRVNDNHLKLFLDFYVSKKHVISIEAGHTILRKFKITFRDEGKPVYYNMNVTDGLLFRIAYAYRVRTDE